MRTHSKALSLLAAVSAALIITGCCSTTTAKSTSTKSTYAAKPAPTPAPTPAPAHTPAPAPAAAPRGSGTCGTMTTFEEGGQKYIRGTMGFPTGIMESSGLMLEKVVPAEVLAGRPFSYEYKVVNLLDCAIADVSVMDQVTDNFQSSDASPRPDSVNGGVATWKIGTMGPREVKVIKVTGSASQEGTITTCGWATYSPILCEPIKVVKPAIELVKTMPDRVTQCDPIPVKLVVRNSGSSALTMVRVTDTLPSGLTADAGQTVSFDAGTLAPGDSKEFTFNARATSTGSFTNPAKATSAQGVEADAQASVTVVKPALEIACITPPMRDLTAGNFSSRFTEFFGRPFDVCWEVRNTGDAECPNTVITVNVPSGLTARSAADGGSVSGGTVTWNVGTVAPGATRKVCATFVGANAGQYSFAARANCTCAEPASTACDVVIQGINAILVEVVDDPDPIQVGEATTYTIKVTNQGGGLDIEDISVRANFPAEVDPSAPSSGGTVSGKSVTWPVHPRLPLRQTLTYTVRGTGVSPADARLQVEVTTRARQTPITELESTTVY